jgi:chromosome segregation ATPase
LFNKIVILTLSLIVTKSDLMSEIADIVDTLEDKINKLFNKLEGLEKSSQDLQLELGKAATVIKRQSGEIEALQKQYDALKLVNSLLGSEENKRDTKLKINSLIREIDHCIKQLSS